jgi:hypothetical protein
VEHFLKQFNLRCRNRPREHVPAGFIGNSNLNTHLGVYYSKLVMSRQTTDPPDPEDGEIFRFRSSNTYKISAYRIQSAAPARIASGTTPGNRHHWRRSRWATCQDRTRASVTTQTRESTGTSTTQRLAYATPTRGETIYEYASNRQDLPKRSSRRTAQPTIFSGDDVQLNSQRSR